MLKETHFFQIKLKNQFSPIIAFKSTAGEASLWLGSLAPLSPHLLLLGHWLLSFCLSVKLSPNQNPVTCQTDAFKRPVVLVSIFMKVLENVCEHTKTYLMSYTLLEKTPALHSLIKSTHRSPITPVW